MRIRLYDARILSMSKTQPIFRGEVWIQNDKIEKVISYEDQAMKHVKNENDMEVDSDFDSFDQEIDCMGNVLMPGFKNCHAHGPMTFLRSFADDLPLQEWLNSKIFPAEGKLKSEDIYTLMQLAILEYVRGGITTSFEMYFYPDQIAKACEDMGFSTVISGTVFGATKEDVKDAMNTLEKDYEAFHNRSSYVDYRLGFHSEYSCCRELLEEIATLSNNLKAPVYMHNSETKKEVEDCIARYGKTPISLMNEIGLFEYGGAGHHVVYTTEEDRKIMKEKGLFAVTNPSSNIKLKSGMAPLKDYLDLGIEVAIGTDGPASNNNLNFFKEMFLASGLSKLLYEDAAAVSTYDILKMATVNGAHLLGIPADSIEEGKLADLILIDLLKPNMQPINNLVNNLVYSGSVDNVLMTMIHGNIVYTNGKYFMNVDPIDVYKEANLIIRRIENEL